MDQTEEVKNKIDIVQLIGEYMPLKRAGRNYKGLCPFHGEKTPSFMVNPELQIFKCFGCGAGGDAYSFMEKIEGMDFGEALQTLAKKAGIVLKSYKPSPGEEIKERLMRMQALAAEAYHYVLTKHEAGKKALAYAKSRGIADETIERFKLGYAPEGWDFVIKFLVNKKGYKIEDLEAGGLAIKAQGYYDRFRDRLMFPLNNQRGQTVGFAGRVMPLSAEATEGQAAREVQQAKYVNTPETEIYHKSQLLYGLDVVRSEIKLAGWAVVVEGEIDAIASYQAGVKNVVAIKGSALTEKQVELLRRICDTVVLGLDADVAGDAAARRGITIADKAGLTVKIVDAQAPSVNPQGFKDPGDWGTKDPAGWRAAVEKAIPIFDFYLESAVKRFGLEVTGKKKIGQELLPIWSEISDEIVKAHYIKKLAEVVEVDEEDVRKQMSKIGSNSSGLGLGQAKSEEKKSRREVLEEYVVGLAIRGEKTEMFQKDEIKDLIRGNFWSKVVEEVIRHKAEITDNLSLVAVLPAELRTKVEELIMKENGEEGDSWDKEWKNAINELKEVIVREEIEKVKEIGDGEALKKLTQRLSELTKDK